MRPALVSSWEGARERLSALCYLMSALCLSSLAGCAGNPQQHADALAQPTGLKREQVYAKPFLLTAYARITRIDQAITIYIEGDGHAWRNRFTASDDPTPRRALGLSLAAADSSANVVYLARPCQFTAMADNPPCDPTYWTSKRFAPEVITAIDSAITHYASRTPGQRIHLVGYSGGGAIAIIVAAQRQDVATLRTVAGNLDHDAVNRWHEVSLMPNSLNAINVVPQVAHIPQIHFSGANDKIVPTAIAQDFVSKDGACASLRIIDGLSHEGDWAAIWPQLLKLRPLCVNRRQLEN